MEKSVHREEKVWFLPNQIYLEGDEGRAKRCISARSGGVPPSSQAEENEA